MPEVLDSLRRRSSRRFPMEIVPSGALFPVLEMDRQLLRYIYRNAVSNACKYGKKDGVISTRVLYDRSLQLLTMQVINFPGVGHDRLCLLPASEVAKVFEQDTQLKATQEVTSKDTEAIPNDSSGNGAWIMKKVNIRHFGVSVVVSFMFQHLTIFGFFSVPNRWMERWISSLRRRELSSLSPALLLLCSCQSAVRRPLRPYQMRILLFLKVHGELSSMTLEFSARS